MGLETGEWPRVLCSFLLGPSAALCHTLWVFRRALEQQCGTGLSLWAVWDDCYGNVSHRWVPVFCVGKEK